MTFGQDFSEEAVKRCRVLIVVAPSIHGLQQAEVTQFVIPCADTVSVGVFDSNVEHIILLHEVLMNDH